MIPEIEAYYKRTGQDEREITGGFCAFAIDRVLKLVAEAERLNKKPILENIEECEDGMTVYSKFFKYLHI